MKKTTSLLIATAIVGSISLSALTPAAYADNGKRGEGRDQEKMQKRGGQGGPGGFLRMACSTNGAERLETVFGKVSEKITLTEEQTGLYDDLKTAALAAQTDFANNCTKPERGENAETDMIDNIKTRQANMTAHMAAMDSVVPSLEAFYDSLTDEQKADLKPKRGDRDGDRRGHSRKHGGRNG